MLWLARLWFLGISVVLSLMDQLKFLDFKTASLSKKAALMGRAGSSPFSSVGHSVGARFFQEFSSCRGKWGRWRIVGFSSRRICSAVRFLCFWLCSMMFLAIKQGIRTFLFQFFALFMCRQVQVQYHALSHYAFLWISLLCVYWGRSAFLLVDA